MGGMGQRMGGGGGPTGDHQGPHTGRCFGARGVRMVLTGDHQGRPYHTRWGPTRVWEGRGWCAGVVGALVAAREVGKTSSCPVALPLCYYPWACTSQR
jgi:hypothetical protein